MTYILVHFTRLLEDNYTLSCG